MQILLPPPTRQEAPPPEPHFPPVSHGAPTIRKDTCQAHSMGFGSQQYRLSTLVKVAGHVCVETRRSAPSTLERGSLSRI